MSLEAQEALESYKRKDPTKGMFPNNLVESNPDLRVQRHGITAGYSGSTVQGSRKCAHYEAELLQDYRC